MIIQKKLIKPIENKGAVKIPLSSREHSTTTNRDAPNQHPQEAITGLTSDLNTIRTDIVDNSASVSSVKSEITKLQVEIDAKPDKLFVETQLANKANKTEIDTIDAALEVHSTNISDNAANILLKANETELVNKQDKLTAGANIDITDNVISSTGGGGSGDVTLDTAQNITGIKTFTNGIKNNLVEVDGKSLIIKNSSTAASYLEVESVYSGSGYKNWFGIQLFRTTGTSRSRLANLEIRQDDGLYIACVNDVSIQGSNIKFNNARLQQVRTPTADDDAATKKYADDGLSLKVDKTEIAAIDAAIELNTNNITKNTADILLKANETEITAIDAKLVINTNNITKNADDILLKATTNYVDEEIVKVNSSLTNLAKAVNILVGTFDVSWTSKTTAVDAGTNLKTAIGDVLWSEVIKPENKNKYFIKAIFAATAEGTAFHEKIESYNILSTSGQEVYFSGATSFTHLRYNDPGNGATVETILMVNSEGNVRFYVKFGGTLNSNFSISKVKLFINEIF